LRVRFTADASVEAGSRMITLRSNGSKSGTVAIDVAPGTRPATAPASTKAGSPRVAESDRPNDAVLSEARGLSDPTTSDAKAGAQRLTESGDAQTQARTPVSKGLPQFGPRQKGDLRLVLNGCTGFRLTSGAEQSCGGSADIEINSRGASLTIEADGIRTLGAASVDQAENLGTDGMSSSAALQPGSTYLIKMRRGLAVLRVVQARGIESFRNAPPAALRGPRMGGAGREPLGGSTPSLTLVLEWKTLQP